MLFSVKPPKRSVWKMCLYMYICVALYLLVNKLLSYLHIPIRHMFWLFTCKNVLIKKTVHETSCKNVHINSIDNIYRVVEATYIGFSMDIISFFWNHNQWILPARSIFGDPQTSLGTEIFVCHLGRKILGAEFLICWTDTSVRVQWHHNLEWSAFRHRFSYNMGTSVPWHHSCCTDHVRFLKSGN